MSPDASRTLFAHVVDRDDEEIELDVAALLLGELEAPGIELDKHLAFLDELAAATRANLAVVEGGDFAEIRALNKTLFDDFGFRGDEVDYYDPRNSFLSDVLQRRVGIPISLSVLYMEVGRRIGIAISGIGFPGHFLCRYDTDDAAVIVDAFRLGMTLDEEDLQELLDRASGRGLELTADHLEPATKREIVSRMLANLAGIYGTKGDLPRSVEVLERMAIVTPYEDKVLRELERLRRTNEELN